MKKGEQTISTKVNKALVRLFYEEFLNAGNLAVADEVLAEDHVWYLPNGAVMHGREAMKQHLGAASRWASDLRIIIKDMIAEGDEVATRFTESLAFTVEYGGIPPTGNEVLISGIAIQRIAGGKIVESWERSDTLSTAQQMGMIPAPQPRD